MKSALDAFASSIHKAEQALSEPMNELIQFINEFEWDHNSWKSFCKKNASFYDDETAGRGALWVSEARTGNVSVRLAVGINVQQGSFDQGHYLQIDETISTGCKYYLGIYLEGNRDDFPEFKAVQHKYEGNYPLVKEENFSQAKKRLIELQNDLIGEAISTLD